MIDLSRSALERHSLDMRQFIDARASTLPGGQRIIDVYNSSGLNFTLLPDRGLDIWTAHYKGLPLTWISQGSPHAPDFGASWLRQFNGGLLTTCGLRHAGPPETDTLSGEQRDVHGLYTRLKAYNLNIAGAWLDEDYALEVRATITEAGLFQEQLRLERVYRVVLGRPEIEIRDTVRNLYDTPVPLMVLYHFNVGYPLVRDGAQLYTPSQAIIPRDEAARAGHATWHTYGNAVPGYAEQVFYHHVKQQSSLSRVLLSNGDMGLRLEWDTRSAPYFTQWKNLRQGIYVSGIEPGNCLPEGQNAARQHGRLQMLQPGETRDFACRLYVAASAALPAEIKAIEALESDGYPAAGFNGSGL